MARRTPATDGMAAPRLPRASRVLLLVDFINPLNFPGSEKLAPGALQAARDPLNFRHYAKKVLTKDLFDVGFGITPPEQLVRDNRVA